MKLDCREKFDRLKRFVADLKTSPGFHPFLTLEDLPRYGVFDFYPLSRTVPSIATIERKIKEQKYEVFRDFLADLRVVFTAVSDYVFEDDPLQEECANFLEQVADFELCFREEFGRVQEPKESRSRQRQQAGRKIKDHKEEITSKSSDEWTTTHRAGLMERLQMLFHLQNNQTNELYLRSVGEQFQMGSEDQQYYYLTITSKNSSWIGFLQNERY